MNIVPFRFRILCGKCSKVHRLTMRTLEGKKKFSCRLKARWTTHDTSWGGEPSESRELNFTRKREEECRIYKLAAGEHWMDVSVVVSRIKIWSA